MKLKSIKKSVRGIVKPFILGAGLLTAGNADAFDIPFFGRGNHPDVSIHQEGFDINGKKLEKIISKSITYKPNGWTSQKSVERELEEHLEEEHLENVDVSPYGSFLDDSYYSTQDRTLEVYMGGDYFSQEEIDQVLKEENIPYIIAVTEPHKHHSERDTTHVIMSEENRKLLADKLDERFPSRKKDLKTRFDGEFDREIQARKDSLVGTVERNKNIFLNLTGSISPFNGDYDHYENELDLDRDSLSVLFNRKGYRELFIEMNEGKFHYLMGLINRNSGEDSNLTIFYNGHGDENGLAFEFGDYLTVEELAESLEGYKGNATVFVNSCFSGNVRDYFEENDSDVTVVSSSKTDKNVSSSEYDKPGYLVADLLESDMNLDEFDVYFKDNKFGKYHPTIYRPEEKE